MQPSLNNNAVTQDSPEVFSISKPNRDSQIAGGQIRPQQVQVKLGMSIIELWKVDSFFLCYCKKGIVCTFTFVRIVHCVALYIFLKTQMPY